MPGRRTARCWRHVTAFSSPALSKSAPFALDAKRQNTRHLERLSGLEHTKPDIRSDPVAPSTQSSGCNRTGSLLAGRSGSGRYGRHSRRTDGQHVTAYLAKWQTGGGSYEDDNQIILTERPATVHRSSRDGRCEQPADRQARRVRRGRIDPGWTLAHTQFVRICHREPALDAVLAISLSEERSTGDKIARPVKYPAPLLAITNWVGVSRWTWLPSRVPISARQERVECGWRSSNVARVEAGYPLTEGP